MKKTEQEKNFERVLPEGYRLAVHLDAKSVKLGVIMNLAALVLAAVVMALAVFAFVLLGGARERISVPPLIALSVFCVGELGYMVLHELTHGFVYKHTTGEKLTFGMSWSCAFCGVPNIYVYRKTAIRACAAPLVVFSAIFLLLTVVSYCLSPILYFVFALLLALHLGGCSGDIYGLLLLAKHKDARVLMRDTGPEQFLYVPDGEEK